MRKKKKRSLFVNLAASVHEEMMCDRASSYYADLEISDATAPSLELATAEVLLTTEDFIQISILKENTFSENTCPSSKEILTCKSLPDVTSMKVYVSKILTKERI